MNKKVIILAILVVLAIAYAVMKKDATQKEMPTPVAVEEVIANEEANGAVPTPDVVVEEEGIVIDEVMPTPEEVAPVAEEVAPDAPVAPEAPVAPAAPVAGN